MEDSFFAAEFENVWKYWKAKQNEKGVIYYVNDTTQVTSWSHPYFKKLLEELDVRHNEIRYAAYRTSLKLKDLQHHIGLNWIQLAAIKRASADLPAEDDHYLSYSEALSVIQSALHISDKQNHKEEDIAIAADLILNLMMDLYDVNRSGKLLSRSVRYALVTMCNVRLGEKYKFFFASVKDENQNVSKEKLYNLLDDLMQFPYIVKEGESFGRNLAATCDSCFKSANNERISGEVFYSWLKLYPQTLVWLPTLHRILATETVQHNVSCGVCETVQITGLRYRCMRCLKYELCQRCFLCGHTSLRHKLEHPVREYCLPPSVKDSTKALLVILKNKLDRRLRRQVKTNYLPVNASTEHSSLIDWWPGSIENNYAAGNSGSLDSGLALGSVHEDGVTSALDSQLEGTAEVEVTPGNTNTEMLGESFNNSNPLVGDSEQELAVLSKRDIEIEQQQMKLKIEQLQRENRMLQSKLTTIYKYCDAELTVQESDTEDYQAASTLPSWSRDPLKETTSDVTISPIVHSNASVFIDLATTQMSHTVEDLSCSSTNEEQVDTLDIIGRFTPVGSGQLTTPSLSTHSHNREQLNKLRNFIGHNDSSPQGGVGLESGSVYIPLGCASDESRKEKTETGFVQASLTESTLHNETAYRLSDMSLDFQDSAEKSNSLQSQNGAQSTTTEYSRSTSDLKRVVSSSNWSSSSSQSSFKLSSKRKNKRQPCLIFSSNSHQSKSVSSNLGTSSCTLGGDSENISDNKINLSPMGTNMCKQINEDDNCVEMSEIFRHDQDLLHSHEPTPVQARTGLRWKPLQPVHMSTPVTGCQQHLVTAKSVLKKNLAVALSKYADKENISPSASERCSRYSRSESSIDKTPVSAIATHRKGILMSLNSLSNHSQSSYNLSRDTGGGAGSLSTLFRKAEHIGRRIGEGASDVMDTHERDELEKMMLDFEKECMFDDSARSDVCECPRETSDGSLLAAAHNIGDALTNLVQATEQCHNEVNVQLNDSN